MSMRSETVIFCLLLNLIPISGREPACSRFHYEEQTLEKMIRQEILVTKMKADLDETQRNVMDALADLKNERNKMSMDFERMENRNKEELKKYSEEFEKIKDSSTTHTVAFKAHRITDKSLVDNKVMIFSENLLNTDDVYNNQSGFFTAPVGGIYLFTAQICVAATDWLYFGISLEDNLISRFAGGDNLGGCFTFDAIATVDAGQQVSVRCTGSCSGDSLWNNGNIATSSFSGTLLHGNGK